VVARLRGYSAAVPWTEIFGVFLVSHLVGDFLLQTSWQAVNKYGGLGGSGEPRALFTHVLTYTLAFVPALIWLSGSLGWGVLWVAALIAVPHLVQDDGRLIEWWIRHVKRSRDIARGDWLFTAIDQSFHVLALFAVALLAAS
jgi:type IV secretory pathway TrbD component